MGSYINKVVISMTRPAAPVGWTPSLPRCCPQEEFWSFSCSHCNICADLFLIFTVQHLHFMEDFLHWKNATKKLTNQNCTLGVDRSSRERESWALFALAWPATPTDQGAADKVELYFYLHFISLYLYLYLYLPNFLWLMGRGGWSTSTQEPQRYQTPFFVLKCCYTVKTVSPPFGDITST